MKAQPRATMVEICQEALSFMESMKGLDYPQVNVNEICRVLKLDAAKLATSAALFTQAAVRGDVAAAIGLFDLALLLGLAFGAQKGKVDA